MLAEAHEIAEMLTCAVVKESAWLWESFTPALRHRYFRAVGDALLTYWYGALSPADSDWKFVASCTVPCSYWEPSEYAPELQGFAHNASQRELSKFLALCVRNGPLEDIHVKHITDAQMHRLNVCIRSALYSALVAAERIDTRSEKYLDGMVQQAPLLDGIRFRLRYSASYVYETARLLKGTCAEGYEARILALASQR